jgi:DNA-binding CsgD family transcriptional regulator
MKKNELLNDVSQRLLEIRKSSKSEEKEKIYKIIVELNSATNDDVWQDFELRFNEVYNDFYERLMEQFPHLTPNDRKLCAFLRLNLSSKEICAITRQSPNSLNVSRARLRKKLGIDNSDTDLITFLEKI